MEKGAALLNFQNLVVDSLSYQGEKSRRKSERFRFSSQVDWDYFVTPDLGSLGVKSGTIEDISEGGCLLRASELIEHRRKVRIIAKESSGQLLMVLVGAIVRREDKLEPCEGRGVSLHRYGIEFTHPLNPVFLEKIKCPHGNCAVCGTPAASIPDPIENGVLYCVLCHLRRACHNLLAYDTLDTF